VTRGTAIGNGPEVGPGGNGAEGPSSVALDLTRADGRELVQGVN
jgi:hypothetical protein